MVIHQPQVERRTGKVRRSKTNVLPTVPRNQPSVLHYEAKKLHPFYFSNNFVTPHYNLITFGTTDSEINLQQNCDKTVHLSWWLFSPYLVKRNIKSPGALGERKPPPTPKFRPKVIRDSNPHCRIRIHNVCRVCPKMLWMYYLVSVSHFAKYGTNIYFIQLSGWTKHVLPFARNLYCIISIALSLLAKAQNVDLK